MSFNPPRTAQGDNSMIRTALGLLTALLLLSTPALAQDTAKETGDTGVAVDTGVMDTSAGLDTSATLGGTGLTSVTGGTGAGGIVYDTGLFPTIPGPETYSAADLLGEEGGANCANCSSVGGPSGGLMWVWLVAVAAIRRR